MNKRIFSFVVIFFLIISLFLSCNPENTVTKLETPTYSYDKTQGTITFKSSQSDVSIKYVFQGGKSSRSGETRVGVPVQVDPGTQVVASAVKPGYQDSDNIRAYIPFEISLYTEFYNNNSRRVIVTSNIFLGSIRYTKDGSTPTIYSPELTEEVSFPYGTTVKVKGFSNLGSESDEMSIYIDPSLQENDNYSFIENYEEENNSYSYTIERNNQEMEFYYSLDGYLSSESTRYEDSFVAYPGDIVVIGLKTDDGEINELERRELPFGVTVSSSLSGNGVRRVEISSNAPNSTIHYTTDGNEPTQSSPTYTEPFEVATGSVVKAFVLSRLNHVSEVVTYNVPQNNRISEVSVLKELIEDNQYRVTIYSETEGVEYYYTLDDQDPTRQSTRYTSPITVSLGDVIKILAYKESYEEYPIIREVMEFSISARSEFSRSGYRNIILITDDPRGSIYYTTDGSTPTQSSTRYTEPFEVSCGTVIKAFAENSTATVQTDIYEYTAPENDKIQDLSISISATDDGQYEVSITSSVNDAEYHYTLDDSEPTRSSTLYSGPFTVSNGTTIKVLAYKDKYDDCPVLLSVASGVSMETQYDSHGKRLVSLSSVINEMVIYYTTDGSEPSASSIEYTEPFVMDTGTEIKAVAINSFGIRSTVFSGIVPENPKLPEIVVNSEYAGQSKWNITLSSEVEGVTFYWSLDGSDPVVGGEKTGNTFTADSKSTVKIIGVCDGYDNSDVKSYLVLDNPLVQFQVRYYWQNIEDDEYTLHETKTHSAKAETSVNCPLVTYDGFTSPEVKTLYVNYDGSSVEDYYYTRNQYTVTLKKNNGKSSTTYTGRYGHDLSDLAPEKEGRTFDGWYSDAGLSERVDTIPASNATLYAGWEEETKTSDFSYTLRTGATINGYTGQETDVVIPSYIDDLPVTSITSSSFSGKISVRSVEAPKTLQAIGDAAFNGCSSLEELTLPFVGNHRDSYNQYGLFGCIFGTNYYQGGKGVTQYYNSYNNRYTYYIPESLKKVTITDGKTIRYGAFYGITWLEEINLNEGITSIETLAFFNNTSLKEMTVPSSVTSMGEKAFYQCSGIESITLPFTGRSLNDTYYPRLSYIFDSTNDRIYDNLKSVTITNETSVKQYAFDACHSLTTINYDQEITGIGIYAFYNCSSLENRIVIPETITSIGSYAFGRTSDKLTVVLDCSLGKIMNLNYSFGSSNPGYNSKNIFDYSTAKLIVNKTDDLTTIPSYAFYGCQNLESIHLSSSITSVGENAFNGCNNLDSIQLDEGSTAFCMEDGVLYNADKTEIILVSNDTPESYEIPSSVTKIGQSAFAGKTNITSLTIPDTVISIGRNAFDGWTDSQTIVINCPLSVIMDTGASYNESRPGYNSKGVFSDCEAKVKINNTEGLSSIPSYTFYGWSGLESIDLADTIGSIGTYAFKGCSSLTSIRIPEEVTTISDYLFQGCSNLSEISLATGTSTVGVFAFDGCSSLTSISLSNVLTSIGQNAFAGCTSLTSLSVPASVTFIGYSAFSGWTEEQTIEMDCPLSVIMENGTYNTQNPGYNSKGIFTGCEAKVKINNTEGLSSIPSYTFYGWSGLVSIDLADTIGSIGTYAFKGCPSLTSIRIPEEVKTISDYLFQGCSSLREITLATGTESIGMYAFDGCSSLTSITLPTSLVSIGSYSFGSCSSLSSVSIPERVETIGSYAFSNCTSLNSCNIPNGVTSISSNVFENTAITSITIPQNVTSIGSEAFKDCLGLTEVVVPSNVNTIGSGVFNGCNNLTSLTIPFTGETLSSTSNTRLSYIFDTNNHTVPESLRNVTVTQDIYVKANAFNSCSNLSSITYTQNVTGIGDYAFFNCTGLTDPISIPDTVTSIGTYAYSQCKTPSELTIPNSVENIGTGAFASCSEITTLVIPSSVESIGPYAFNGCDNLASITLPFTGNNSSGTNSTRLSYIFNTADGTVPESLRSVTVTQDTYVKANAFNSCSNLTSITYEKAVTEIGDYAFFNCTGLTDPISIPDTVTSIGTYAYSQCKMPSELTIPSSVESIGARAFDSCVDITTLLIPNSVISIGVNAFNGCSNLVTVTVPFTGTSANDYSNKKFSYIFDNLNGTIPESVREVTVTEESIVRQSAFENCSNLTSITYSKSVTSIGSNAFKGCTGLREVEVPSTVETIGEKAYYQCNMKSNLVIPDGVTFIGADAFGECTGIESLTLPFTGNKYSGSSSTRLSYIFDSINHTVPESLRNVTVTIEENVKASAFEDCSNLTSIVYSNTVKSIGANAYKGCSGLTATSYVVPEGITSIGSYAFSGMTGLTSITLPESLTSIGEGAFENCTSVTEITIPASVESIGSSAFSSWTNGQRIVFDCPATVLFDPNGSYDTTNPGYNNKAVLTDCDAKYVVNNTDGIQQISDHTFYNAQNLESIVISSSVNSIGKYAFYKCSGLKEINIPSTVISVGNYAFSQSGLESATISSKYIGNSAFAKLNDLTSVLLTNNVENIDNLCFSNSTGITSLEIPSSVTSVGLRAFEGWTADQEITFACPISALMNESGNYSQSSAGYLNVFQNSRAKIHLRLSSSTTNIPSYAFYNCKELISVVVPPSVSNIDDYAFYGCDNLETAVYDSSSIELGTNALPESFTHVTVQDPTITERGNFSEDISYRLITIEGEEGSDIYYTTDGSVPSYFSTRYNPKSYGDYSAVKVPASSDVRAIVYKNEQYSKVVTASAPVASVRATECGYSGNNNVLLQLSCDTQDVSIYYTLDETEPTSSSTLYSPSDNTNNDGESFSCVVIPTNKTVKYVAYKDGKYSEVGMVTTTSKCSITFNLNSQWDNYRSGLSADDYYSFYSTSNYHVTNSTATMYINIEGYDTFTIYIRSYAESTYDYTRAYEVDSTSVKETTYGFQKSDGSNLSNYKMVTYTGLRGGSHSIMIDYRKDGSIDGGADRGYLIVPKNQ